jgi:hypothetical protein
MDAAGLVRLKGRLLAMLAVGLRVALVPAREERAAFDPAFRTAADLVLSGRRASRQINPPPAGRTKGGMAEVQPREANGRQKSGRHECMNS